MGFFYTYSRYILWTFFSFLLFAPSVYAQTTSSYGERIFYYSTLKSNVTDFEIHASKIDIIAPQTYEITYNLTASGTVPFELANAATMHHVKVMPLITNKDFNEALIHRFLSSASAQENLISFLANEAETHGYIGWQFDLEHIPATDAEAFSTFVEKAATALHSRGKILSAAVVVRTNDDPTSDFYQHWSGAYQYTRLAAATDFLSVMTYDDPESKGPSASLPFVKNTLAYLTNKIPANKISLGIPLFYWAWDTALNKRINAGGTFSMLEQRRAWYNHWEGFNPTYNAPFLLYWIGKKMYIAWYENENSFTAKAQLIPANHLRGFSAWVLGSEDPAIWNTL